MSQEINYIEIIKSLENDLTIELIGQIDIGTLENMDGDDLLYIFPLIERMIVEIYKLVPAAIIENNTQGIMKTITQIIKDNESNNVFIIQPELKELIFKYYNDDNSLRNLLFHAHDGVITIEYNKVEIYCIVASLLKILNMQIKQFDIKNLKKIEKI